MSKDPKQIFQFPDEFPPMTTGLVLFDNNQIITGHYNGFLVLWDIESNNYDILQECGDIILTISISPSNQILVGCHSGLIFYFDLTNPEKRTIIQEPTGSKSTRVWRSIWPTDDNFITTSTYGGLNLFQKFNSEWKRKSLFGHRHSIFGITNKNGNYIVSGDYNGNVIIWQKNEEEYDCISELKVVGSVQGIIWIKDVSFAVIDDLGYINIIEEDSSLQKWKIVLSVNIATSKGNCIHTTNDGKTVFAGTNTELIQLDVDSQRIQRIELENAQKIFSKNNQIYVLTDSGLFTFERNYIETPLELIKYRYAKVSLIGHTGVGKSTLCSKITGSEDNVKSTLGKKIWTYTLDKYQFPQKRIIFHDHGGQETVLSTFLPFLSDSNIILVFFAKNDKTTFEKAIEIIEELKNIVNSNSKICLVKTFIDEDIDEVDSNLIDNLIETGDIESCFEISPKTGLNLDEFLKKLIMKIDWPNSKIMAQSNYVEGLMKTITNLSNRDDGVVDFNSLKQYYEEQNNPHITKSHLNFLLTSFSNQGLIEYYPDILKSVIFHDEEYNKLRTMVPILAYQKHGIISMQELEKEYPSTYLQILDSVFQKFSISIKENDRRIFPAKLRTKPIEIPNDYQEWLTKSIVEKKLYPIQKIKLNSLIRSLIDLKLHCVDVSKKDGLFAWHSNACIYYSIEENGDSITGRNILIIYHIGGKNKEICEKLNYEFSTILERLFGPTVNNNTS